MLELFSHFVKFITDQTQRWTKKSAVVVLIVFTFWLINNTFDFIHSYRMDSKFDQLETIGRLIKDSTLSDEQVDILIKERQRIFFHKTLLEKASSLFDKITYPWPLNKQLRPQNPVKNTSVPIIEKNYWLIFISSNFFLLYALAGVLVNFQFKKDNPTWVNVTTLFIVIIIFFLIGAFVAFLFNLIPLIKGNAINNYFINFFIQFGLVLISAFIYSKLYPKK